MNKKETLDIVEKAINLAYEKGKQSVIITNNLKCYFETKEECEAEVSSFAKESLKSVNLLLSKDYQNGYEEGIRHYLEEIALIRNVFKTDSDNIEPVKKKKGSKYYLKERNNPQLSKPYYKMKGLMTKKEVKKLEGSEIYGSNIYFCFNTKEEYESEIERLKSKGFTVS